MTCLECNDHCCTFKEQELFPTSLLSVNKCKQNKNYKCINNNTTRYSKSCESSYVMMCCSYICAGQTHVVMFPHHMLLKGQCYCASDERNNIIAQFCII